MERRGRPRAREGKERREEERSIGVGAQSTLGGARRLCLKIYA